MVPEKLPLEDYAPTAVNVGDSVLYFMASAGETRPIYKSRDPKAGKWEIANPMLSIVVWDPCLFLDDDNRLYLYWGCNNGKPIFCTELDLKNNLRPIGNIVECFGGNFEEHGWEQGGENNNSTGWAAAPFVEGAWINKVNGKYYLQYAAPGTQWRIYADGVYTSDKPMGPFRYEPYNPFSYKPGGFAGGAGHSSTFKDKNGNWWHICTSVISDKHIFERRISLFQAGFDNDGVLYCHTTWGDYPQSIPTAKRTSLTEAAPEWMLLSYNKKLTASSMLDGYPLANAADEDIKSYWSAQTGNKGEWLLMDMEKEFDVYALQVNFAEHLTKLIGRTADNYFQYTIEYSADGTSWKMLLDKSRNTSDVPHDYTMLKKPVKARYIRLTNVHVPDGTFAVRGLRVFGKGIGAVPATPVFEKWDRNPYNQRRFWLVWNEVPGATGYIVRFGMSKDKLYHSVMVHGKTQLDMNFMNKGVDYYFTVEAFNEYGVSPAGSILELPHTGSYKP